MRKPRIDSKLLLLPPEVDKQLLDWVLARVSYEEIVPKLKEMGIRTSTKAISRWWKKRGSEMLAARRSVGTDMAAAVVDAARKNPAQWDAATVEKMKERIFTVTMDPASDPKELAELFKAVLKREDLDLTREKLRIEMQSDTERAIAAFADEVKGDPEAEALVQELRKRVMAKMERNAG